jgi:diaminopimelate epimerase
MSFIFHKMHGLGNDFVLIDLSQQSVSLSSQHITAWSDRKFGVGFDQLLVIDATGSAVADYSYRIFNQDGSEVKQCGNGARCVGLYLYLRARQSKTSWTLETLSGLMTVNWLDGDHFSVDLSKPNFAPSCLPMRSTKESLFYTLCESGVEYEFAVVNVGNPHICLFVDDLSAYDCTSVGAWLSSHAMFPEGVNVGFVMVTGSASIRLQVYERGVGLTLACGSGACAAVTTALRTKKLTARRVLVDQAGGQCTVEWLNDDARVVLSGSANYTFEGKYSSLP